MGFLANSLLSKSCEHRVVTRAQQSFLPNFQEEAGNCKPRITDFTTSPALPHPPVIVVPLLRPLLVCSPKLSGRACWVGKERAGGGHWRTVGVFSSLLASRSPRPVPGPLSSWAHLPRCLRQTALISRRGSKVAGGT